MDSSGDRDDIFNCSATFGDILIIGEQLRGCMHMDRSNLVRDHRYRFRWYSTCFLGSEAVRWLVKTDRAPQQFIAVALMNILQEHSIIHNVTGSGPFREDSHLYRFRKDDGSYSFMEDTAVFLRGHRLCKRLSTDLQGRKMIRTHIDGEQSHDHSMTGCELIDWTVRRHEAPSREEAVKELQELLKNSIIREVHDRRTFRDDQSLYQFRTDFGRDRILLDLILPLPQPEFGGPISDDETTKPDSSSQNLVNNNVTVETVLDKVDGNHRIDKTSRNDSSNELCNHGSKVQHQSNASMSRNSSSKVLADDESNGEITASQMIVNAKTNKTTTERTESGYHSDPVEASPISSLSESPMFDLDGMRERRDDKPSPYSHGVLIRKATVDELEDPDSPFIKKFIRIVSDPVGFGFVIRGDGPVFVKTVDPMGPAAAAGLKVGHYIYSVNDQKVLTVNHKDLAHVILDCNGYVTLVIMEHVRDSR